MGRINSATILIPDADEAEDVAEGFGWKPIDRRELIPQRKYCP